MPTPCPPAAAPEPDLAPSPPRRLRWLLLPALLALPLSACPEPDDDDDTAVVLQPRATEDAPVDLPAARSATLLVSVRDEDGLAISGARVTWGPHSVASGELGSAGLRGIQPGDDVLRIVAPGRVPLARAVHADDGALVRIVAELPARGDAVTFALSAGATAADGDATATLSANGLEGLLGGPPAGGGQLWLTELDPSSLPAPPRGAGAPGDRLVFEPIAAVDVALAVGGVPANVGADSSLTVAFSSFDSTGLSTGDSVPAWRLDHATGAWRAQPDHDAVVAGGAELVAALPRGGTWAFGSTVQPSCVKLELEAPACVADDLEYRWTGGGATIAGRLLDGSAELLDLTSSDGTLELLEGNVVLDSAQVSPSAQSGDSCSATSWTGQLTAQLRVHTRAGLCAAPSAIVVRSPSGDVLAQEPAAASGVISLDGLPSETVTVCGLTPDDDEFGCQSVALDSGDCDATEVVITVDPEFAVAGDGGCADIPCPAGSCDSCLDLRVRSETNGAVPLEYVNVFAPEDLAHATDTDGETCVDIEDGAGQTVSAWINGAPTLRAELPAEVDCASGGCARREIWRSDTGLPCPTGRVVYQDDARLMGFRDPGYFPADAYAAPSGTGPSRVLLSAAEGDDPLWNQVDGTLEADDVVWAYERLSQDGLGVEAVDSLVVRVDLDTVGLGLIVDGGLASLELGEHAVGASGLDIQVEARDLGDNTVALHDASGLLRVDQADASQIVLTFELELEGAGGSGQLSGALWAPVIDQSSTDRLVSLQRSRGINGAYVAVVEDDHPGGFLYGPSGQFPAVASNPDGEIEYCVPQDGWYMLAGEAFDGFMRPFTALQEYRVDDDDVGRLSLFGNDHEDSWLFAAYRARWFERSYVERVYEVNGLSTASLDQVATIYGVARTWNGSSLEALSDFEAVWLEDSTGNRIDGARIRDDFTFAAAGDGGAVFAFTNVPPRDASDPWTLRLLDDDGAEVAPYTQRIATLAGGVMIAHN